MVTREQWLRECVTSIKKNLWGGVMPTKEYLICSGKVSSKRALGTTAYPAEEDELGNAIVSPVSIYIKDELETVDEIIGTLIHECVHAFFDVRNHGKDFASYAKEVGFNKPFTQFVATDKLYSNINLIRKEVEEKLGEYPLVVFKPLQKPKKERKSNIVTLFCPTCHFECKTNKKMIEEHGYPTCACGQKMGAVDDEVPAE